MWLLGAGGRRATPSQAEARKPRRSPLWRLPPPSAVWPSGASGQMGPRIRTASAARLLPHPGHQRPKMATLALLANVPQVSWGPLRPQGVSRGLKVRT